MQDMLPRGWQGRGGFVQQRISFPRRVVSSEGERGARVSADRQVGAFNVCLPHSAITIHLYAQNLISHHHVALLICGPHISFLFFLACYITRSFVSTGRAKSPIFKLRCVQYVRAGLTLGRRKSLSRCVIHPCKCRSAIK